MIEANAGELFEARVVAFPLNLPAGHVGVQILDNDGHVAVARVTSPFEDPAGSGSYVTTLRAPLGPGQYSLLWDFTGSTPIQNAWEDMVVDAVHWVPPQPTEPGVGNDTIYGLPFQYVHGSEVIPHFDLPFRFTQQGHVAVADQDTLEDIGNCVEAILRTQQGERLERPGFGIVAPTFDVQPLDLDAIQSAVLASENRAHLFLEQAPDQFEAMAADINVTVTPTGGAE